jgi:hypothetical protein
MKTVQVYLRAEAEFCGDKTEEFYVWAVPKCLYCKKEHLYPAGDFDSDPFEYLVPRTLGCKDTQEYRLVHDKEQLSVVVEHYKALSRILSGLMDTHAVFTDFDRLALSSALQDMYADEYKKISDLMDLFEKVQNLTFMVIDTLSEHYGEEVDLLE